MTDDNQKKMIDLSRNLAHFLGEAAPMFDEVEIDLTENGSIDFEFRELLVRSLLRSQSLLQDYVIKTLEDSGNVPLLKNTGIKNKADTIH